VSSVEQITYWTRARGLIGPEDRLLVIEEPVERSGYPPWQVVLTQQGPSGEHVRVIHKRLEHLREADVLGAWRDHSICCG
jgi:hypothetical protein